MPSIRLGVAVTIWAPASNHSTTFRTSRVDPTMILDFKPKAEKQKPIEQLTLYAMALSRLTGLRLFEFKCAWFDEKDYFEFFPLHVLHKLKKRRQRKVYTMEGVYKINQDKKKISSLRPTNLKPKEYVIH